MAVTNFFGNTKFGPRVENYVTTTTPLDLSVPRMFGRRTPRTMVLVRPWMPDCHTLHSGSIGRRRLPLQCCERSSYMPRDSQKRQSTTASPPCFSHSAMLRLTHCDWDLHHPLSRMQQ